MSECFRNSDIVGRHVVVEEKVDGANCGIRFDADGVLRLQSRGHELAGGPRERQFGRLKQWAASVEGPLFDALTDRYVLYGEWCFAKHTVFYDELPDPPLLEFDVLDTATDAFLDTPGRRALLAGVPVASVPVLYAGPATTVAALAALVGPSAFATAAVADRLAAHAARLGLDPDEVLRQSDATGRMEGLYLKLEQDGRTVDRLKWVRPDFTAQIVADDGHWHDRPIVPNLLRRASPN